MPFRGDTTHTAGDAALVLALRGFSELRAAHALHCALPMYDVHALEAINHDQLVTRTDRLLLRGRGYILRDSQSRPSLDLTHAAAIAVRASRARAELAEQTLHMRSAASTPFMGAAAVAIVITWLATTAVCLLA